MTVQTARPRKRTDSPGETLADVLERLGDIPLDRIWFRPYPGTATEKDVIAARHAPKRRFCELVEGVLVEKAMGTREAFLAAVIVQHLMNFLDQKALGVALGADGYVRLFRGLVRIPDVSFISWDRLPQGQLPDEAIATVVPDLAVEILSEGNTKKEIARKLHDYFKAGVRLAWVVDRKKQVVDVYHSADTSTRLSKSQALDGENVLPGFNLPLRKLFGAGIRRHGRS